MSDRSENLLFVSGILIGLGVGLFVGVGMAVVGVFFVLHHMFVPGTHWFLKLLLCSLVPVIIIAAGWLTRKFARRRP